MAVRVIVIVLLLFFLAMSPNLLWAQANMSFQYEAERAMVMLEALRENTINQALSRDNLISLPQEGIMAFISRRLRPYAETELEYNDNIYLLKNAREHDFINKINPGIKFILGPKAARTNEKNYLELDLGGNISNYYINQKANRSDPYGRLNASFGKGKHSIDFSQNYEMRSIPASLASAGIPGITDYIYNTTEASWETLFHRFGFDVRYFKENNNYIGDYKLSSTYASQTANFTAFLIPESMPKTRFLFEYRYDIIDYPKALNDFNDYYKNTYWLGVKGKITGKLSGTAKIGYETVRYRTGKEYRTLPVYGNLVYKYSRRISFNFYASRELGTSNYVNEGNGEYLNIGLNNYFQINSKFKTLAGFWWSKYKYGGGDKRFIYTYPIKLEYAFNKWLSADLNYKFESVQSNKDVYKYTNNVFSVGAKAEF